MRALYHVVVAVLWTTIMFPICLVALVIAGSGPSTWLLRRGWAPLLLWCAGARLRVEGLEHVDPSRPIIYVSNHQSTLDIPVLFMALPVNLRFVAKKQLQWVPFIGWYMWLAGYVFVDRGNARKTLASLERAGRQIRAGRSIVLFPEGTRSPDGGIQPFKKGAFVLAFKAHVPLCPVFINGSGRVMPKNSWHVTPGEIRVRIGAPILPSEASGQERARLMDEIRAAIVQLSRKTDDERQPG